MQSTTNGGKALDRAFSFLWLVIKRKKEKVCIFQDRKMSRGGVLIFVVADIWNCSFHTHTACDAFSFQAKNLLDKMLLRVLYKQYNASIHLRLNMFVSHTSQAFSLPTLIIHLLILYTVTTYSILIT